MADKRIHELDELTTPQSTDLLLIEQSSSNVDKKVKLENLVSNDTIERAVGAWLDDHPEATTTVEDGSITPAKLHQDTLDMFDEKADIDGYYEDMSVGSAEQLLSNMFEDDSTPYLYRTSGGSLEIGDRVYEDAIVGGSVAWNQLVENGDFESSTGWATSNATVTISNNTASLTASARYGRLEGRVNVTNGHKYLVMASIKISSGQAIFNATADDYVMTSITGAFERVGLIYQASATTTISFPRIRDNRENNWDAIEIQNVVYHDLTLMFGSTIADYAYTLEQSEAGSGIAWLKSQGFFTKDYYAYNAGGIESVKTSVKKVVGFNQWDEQWENSRFNVTTGAKSSGNGLASKNMIPVIPNTVYHATAGNYGATNIVVLYYDASGSYISYENIFGMSINFTTPSNAYFINFNLQMSSAVTAYNHDICINLHWDGERDGEYEAYEEHTYPLGNDELRGLFKLSNGKIYADGDTKTSDGQITRRYMIVDLGTLNWSKDAYNRFYSSNISTIAPPNNNTIANIITYKYETATSNQVADKDKTIGISSGGVLQVKDSSYEYTSDFKTAMSGVYLVYPLATPTTESADPYTNPQLVDNWGTEEFVDERDVPVPVGHDSRYLPDLKAKIESAPNNPSTNGKYFLQYQNGEATYVPVPSEVPQTPSEDGTYVLKATVSSGTATLSWVAEE